MNDTTHSPGRIGYDAYGDTALPEAWRTFDGRPMPHWEDLTDEIRRRWEVAAMAIRDAALLALAPPPMIDGVPGMPGASSR